MVAVGLCLWVPALASHAAPSPASEIPPFALFPPVFKGPLPAWAEVLAALHLLALTSFHQPLAVSPWGTLGTDCSGCAVPLCEAGPEKEISSAGSLDCW